MQPWNKADIPEGATRFSSYFTWNKGSRFAMKGRMFYNYPERKINVEYELSSGHIRGFYFNYQILKVRVPPPLSRNAQRSRLV